MTYKYWVSGNYIAIFRVGGMSQSMAYHCKILSILWYFDRMQRNHVHFRKYMVLEKSNFWQNGQVDLKKHKI